MHEQYLAQKTRRLREGIFAYSDSDKYKVLQRALEAPINVGRSTLESLTEFGIASQVIDDRKPAVIKRFREIFEGTFLVPRFDTLLQRDSDYTILLREAVRGNVGQQEYEEALSILTHECLPEALYWINDVSELYLNLLEGNKHSVEGNMSRPRRESLS